MQYEWVTVMPALMVPFLLTLRTNISHIGALNSNAPTTETICTVHMLDPLEKHWSSLPTSFIGSIQVGIVRKDGVVKGCIRQALVLVAAVAYVANELEVAVGTDVYAVERHAVQVVSERQSYCGCAIVAVVAYVSHAGVNHIY